MATSGDSLLVCICRQAILEWGNNYTPVARQENHQDLRLDSRKTTMLKDVARLVVKNAALWQPDTWRRWCFIISDQDSISLDRK